MFDRHCRKFQRNRKGNNRTIFQMPIASRRIKIRQMLEKSLTKSKYYQIMNCMEFKTIWGLCISRNSVIESFWRNILKLYRKIKKKWSFSHLKSIIYGDNSVYRSKVEDRNWEVPIPGEETVKMVEQSCHCFLSRPLHYIFVFEDSFFDFLFFFLRCFYCFFFSFRDILLCFSGIAGQDCIIE